MYKEIEKERKTRKKRKGITPHKPQPSSVNPNANAKRKMYPRPNPKVAHGRTKRGDRKDEMREKERRGGKKIHN